jgi:hypothetical protein
MACSVTLSAPESATCFPHVFLLLPDVRELYHGWVACNFSCISGVGCAFENRQSMVRGLLVARRTKLVCLSVIPVCKI